MSRSYPKDFQARETFTDEEFTEAVNAKLASETVVILSLAQSKLRDGLTPSLVHSFAEMAEAIDGAMLLTSYDGLEIRRRITTAEAESGVLADRKSEMWYTEDSPHYVPKSERG